MRKYPARYRAAGISPARLRELQGFCGTYREMQRALRLARAGVEDRRAGSGAWHRPDPTAGAAVRLADHPAARRIRLIDECAAAVAEPVIARAIVRSVADGVAYEYLRAPINAKRFYELRQAFFIELDRRLWNLT